MSWDSLGQIMRDNYEMAEQKKSQPPVDCPNDGWPLLQGPREGQLHCRFGGEVFDSSGKPIFT